MATTLCKQTHWFTSLGYKNVHQVSPPSQRQLVVYDGRMFHQTWTKTTHTCIILYALMLTLTHQKQALRPPFCSFSGDLTVSQAQHRVHSCWYISKVHVHKASGAHSICFCSFTNLQSFDQNSKIPWTDKEKTSGSSTSEVGTKRRNIDLLVWDVYLFMMYLIFPFLWPLSSFNPWSLTFDLMLLQLQVQIKPRVSLRFTQPLLFSPSSW